MNRPLILTSLAAIILASSCDQPRVLITERANIEAEILRTNEEMRAIDAKFETLRASPFSYGKTFDRHYEDVLKKNTELEGELAYMSKKCAEGEAALREIHTRLDTYKAKYLY
ncbi:hypothetical protein [Prosthecobacter sp.]|jgi:hypothetical protein|uniref:hypothetical protein n=1 Tax=Prosthecobacter sp. TaxID=1965333 RepID=UPI0037C8B6D0